MWRAIWRPCAGRGARRSFITAEEQGSFPEKRMTNQRYSVFPSADRDAEEAKALPDTPQTRAPAYRLAFEDLDFLHRERLRPVRLLLELMKPELTMGDAGVNSTVVLFGGARVPDPESAANARTKTLAGLSRYYEEARDRKSTRLNSSHVAISYAVFCLKKKTE